MANAVDWIVVADGSRAQIYQTSLPEVRLKRLEGIDLMQPAAGAGVRDESGDWPPRNVTFGDTRHDIAEERFARSLGEHLDKAVRQHAVRRLVLVAPPKFLGLLQAKLSNHIRGLVFKTVDKDLTQESQGGLEAHLARLLRE